MSLRGACSWLLVAFVGCAAPGDEPGDAGEAGDVRPSAEDGADGATDAADTDECPPGHTRCATGCADLTSDPENCGGCGHVCDSSTVCNEGRCASTCTAACCATTRV